MEFINAQKIVMWILFIHIDIKDSNIHFHDPQKRLSSIKFLFFALLNKR